MSRTEDVPSTPRATIHKQILDAAEADPDASLEAIADEVSGASVDVVRRVFDEYGDPHHETGEPDQVATADGSRESPDEGDDADPEDAPANGDGATAKGDSSGTRDASPEPSRPDPADLRDEQAAVLRLIHRRPDASQAALAEEFDVTRPTISRWVNDLPGFEWDERAEFARQVVGDEAGDPAAATAAGGPSANGDGGATDGDETDEQPADRTGSTTAVAERLASLERRLDDLTGRDGEDGPAGDGELDPDLAHRVVHACMHSERITEDEELRILKALL